MFLFLFSSKSVPKSATEFMRTRSVARKIGLPTRPLGRKTFSSAVEKRYWNGVYTMDVFCKSAIIAFRTPAVTIVSRMRFMLFFS